MGSAVGISPLAQHIHVLIRRPLYIALGECIAPAAVRSVVNHDTLYLLLSIDDVAQHRPVFFGVALRQPVEVRRALRQRKGDRGRPPIGERGLGSCPTIS